MEFAGLFAALGSDVTVVCRGSNVLRGFDEDVRQAVAASYTNRGIKLMLGDSIRRLERWDGDRRRWRPCRKDRRYDRTGREAGGRPGAAHLRPQTEHDLTRARPCRRQDWGRRRYHCRRELAHERPEHLRRG